MRYGTFLRKSEGAVYPITSSVRMVEHNDRPSTSFTWPRANIEAARERNFAATMDLVAERHHRQGASCVAVEGLAVSRDSV